jgi:hypothetical protein
MNTVFASVIHTRKIHHNRACYPAKLDLSGQWRDHGKG